MKKQWRLKLLIKLVVKNQNNESHIKEIPNYV